MFLVVNAAVPAVRPNSIESCRLLAVVLLVSYHVIGAGSDGGLQVSGLHPARLAADFLVDVRMPLFAFISGFVYAIRPVEPDRLGRFIIGKFRRLALPGAVAIALFMVLSEVMGTRFAPGGEWWQKFFLPYAHYWFLQAILLIFVIYCSFDVMTKGRLLLPSLLVASAVYLLEWRLPFRVMSANQAIYLLPYFILGVVVCRHGQGIAAHRNTILAAALLAAVLAAATNLAELRDLGHFSENRRDLQSLAFGMGVSVLLFLTLPPVPQDLQMGSVAFTIYLYHVFATSFTRRALEGIGITSLDLHLLAGVIAGVGLPMLLHLAAARHPWTAMGFLGQRPALPGT